MTGDRRPKRPLLDLEQPALEPGDDGNASIAEMMGEPANPDFVNALEAAPFAIPPPPAFRDQIEDQEPDDDSYDLLLAELNPGPTDDED